MGLLFSGLLLFLANISQSQNIPVGYPLLYENLRRAQLTGEEGIHSSFSSLPLSANSFPSLMIKSFAADTTKKAASDVKFVLLNPTVRTEFNGHHPYYSNNGAIKPVKGISTLISAGGFVKYRFVSIQLKPELLLSQNGTYEGFADSHPDAIWRSRYLYWNRTDTPEDFRSIEGGKILPGQSNITFSFLKGLGVGLSTENLWWGPGKRGALLMTNNAEGFPHLFLRSLSPMKTGIGVFEGQIIAGRLGGSGSPPPEPERRNRNSLLYSPKVDGWRYLSAATFTYQPKWVPGLAVGFTRSFQVYSTFARENNFYFPFFTNLLRENDGQRDELDIDQLLSTHIRWYWKEAAAEFYFEFGRNDASIRLRDLLLVPQHSRAYIFGLSKIISLQKRQLEINYEHVEMSQTINYLINDASSWYLHSRVRHGYTHRGEVLGAGVGPGSDLDHLSANLYDKSSSYGIIIERLRHQSDFYYRTFGDINDARRHWVDYSFGLSASQQLKFLNVEGQLIYSRSLNYQWEISDPLVGNFINGRDVNNLVFRLNVAYIFGGQ